MTGRPAVSYNPKRFEMRRLDANIGGRRTRLQRFHYIPLVVGLCLNTNKQT